MRDRPILFSGPNVVKVRDRIKTQTRRPVRWPDWVPDREAAAYMLNRDRGIAWFKDGRPKYRMTCPYGQPGDRLWVRETWKVEANRWSIALPEVEEVTFGYRADGKNRVANIRVSEWKAWAERQTTSDFTLDGNRRWKPSIHMPRWASRLTLEVTEVRLERLQEITEEDLGREGYEPICMCGEPYLWHREKGHEHTIQDTGQAESEFHGSWDRTYAKRGLGWDANPWVWAVTFARAA